MCVCVHVVIHAHVCTCMSACVYFNSTKGLIVLNACCPRSSVCQKPSITNNAYCTTKGCTTFTCIYVYIDMHRRSCDGTPVTVLFLLIVTSTALLYQLTVLLIALPHCHTRTLAVTSQDTSHTCDQYCFNKLTASRS